MRAPEDSTRPIRVSRASRRAAALLLVSCLLAACGGTGLGEDGEPSVEPTRTPTATLTRPEAKPPETTTSPQPTIPEATSPEATSPQRTIPEATSPEATSPRASRPQPPSPTRTTTTEGTDPSSTTTRSLEPTEEQDVAGPSGSTAAATGQPEKEAAEGPTDQDGAPAWAWWTAGALVVACVIAVPLVLRARRRSTWAQGLEREEAELAWLARDLLPTLRSTRSVEALAGGWEVGQARVAAAEDRLVVLESSAPDEAGQMRARALRDASRRARARVRALVVPGQHGDWTGELDAAIAELELALGEHVVTPSR
jgi:hypothetical protein